MRRRKSQRGIAAAVILAMLLVLPCTAALAAVPSHDINSTYDLQIDTDWQARNGMTIVPAGETLLLAGIWHNGRAGSNTGTWFSNSYVQYTWRSGSRDLVGNIRGIKPWYDPAPSWDPAEQIAACYAEADIGDRQGSTELSCTAIVDSQYHMTGETEATQTVQVVGLTAEDETAEIQLGESLVLGAYWATSPQDTLDDARKFFEENATDMEMWNAGDATWSVQSFETELGVEVTGASALEAAAGPISPVHGAADSFGCRATVTPLQAGTYEFLCTPGIGTGTTTTTVTVLPPDRDAAFGLCTPDTQTVLVPTEAETDGLTQEFAVEVEPGFEDGIEFTGDVYWSVLDHGQHAFFVDESDELMVGETLELTLDESYFTDSLQTQVAAWLVPPDTEADEEVIEQYGVENPDSVHVWTLTMVDQPRIELVSGSDLALDRETGLITGLTAGAEGCNPVGEVLTSFCWNAGSSMMICNEDGDELGADESVGTCSRLRITFPDANIEDLEAMFLVVGDVTGSGTVSVTDLVRMAKALLDPGTLTGLYLDAADFTGSGTITVTDLVREAALLQSAAPGE